MRAQVDPQDLIPKLPKPKDLQPFPNTLSITNIGHKSILNSISVHVTEQWRLVMIKVPSVGRLLLDDVLELGNLIKNVFIKMDLKSIFIAISSDT